MRYTWRSQLLDEVVKKHSNTDFKNMDIYQFGVFNGDSMREISSIFFNNKINFNCFNGYDVFTGMPKETEEPIFQNSWNPDIEPDVFNMVKKTSLASSSEFASFIKKECEEYNSLYQYKIFDGLVQNTLAESFFNNNIKQAFYVDIDLDIYSPSYFVLDFMFKNKLINVGTYIGYDDWGGVPNYENYEFGEPRAHREVCEKYSVEMVKLYEVGNCFPHVHNIWVVKNIN